MVVSDIRKQMLNFGRDARISFLRTEKGFEVDLIISRGTKIQPIEIKSAMTYHDSLAANLRKLAKADSAVLRPHLLYDGDIAIPMFDGNDIEVCNFRNFTYSID